MGMRPQVKIWVGFQGRSIVAAVANAAGFISSSDDPLWEWDTPEGVRWTGVFGDDGNTLVGFGLPLLDVLGPRCGDPYVERIDMSELVRKAESLKTLLTKFLEERSVPSSMIEQIDTRICPLFPG